MVLGQIKIGERQAICGGLLPEIHFFADWQSKYWTCMVPNQNRCSNVVFCQGWAETKVPRNVLGRESGDLGGGRTTW